jgi:glutathione-specific gamma-glutamylcyclotransferase
VWLFAYGSLIFRPGFSFQRRIRGFVQGYERRFWQESTDHRGTPERPGRVVTLVPTPGGRCWGVAYELSQEEFEREVEGLDRREQNGYARVTLRMTAQDRRAPAPEFEVVTYIAPPGNPHYVGEEPLDQLASIIRSSRGPSGHNADYVLNLAEALLELDVEDAHVFELANRVSDPDSMLETEQR